MKKFNLINTPDQETPASHACLRFLTYVTLILLIPGTQYYIEFVDINRIPHCEMFTIYTLPFRLDVISVQFFHAVFIVSALFSSLGLLFRLNSLITFISFSVLTLHALGSCYSNHQFYVIGLVLLFWFINGTTGPYSLDFFLFKNSTRKQPQHIFKFLKIYFCLAFFFSGLSKLMASGFDWITTDNLYNMISLQNYLHEGFPKHQKFFWLNQLVLSNPNIPKILALFTILIEISAPVALFVKNYKWIIIIMVGLMQIGIQLIMYIGFEPWIVLYYVWIFSALDHLLKDKYEAISFKNFSLR